SQVAVKIQRFISGDGYIEHEAVEISHLSQ
ncbi:unnamed protein product, partial [marine sediment metagenome]